MPRWAFTARHNSSQNDSFHRDPCLTVDRIMPPDAADQPPAEVTFAPDKPLALDSERAVWRQVGDEVVILDVPTATYLTLNSSAVTLWDLLAEVATPTELAAKLVATYDLTADKAERDVQHFLGALQERGLILPAK